MPLLSILHVKLKISAVIKLKLLDAYLKFKEI